MARATSQSLGSGPAPTRRSRPTNSSRRWDRMCWPPCRNRPACLARRSWPGSHENCPRQLTSARLRAACRRSRTSRAGAEALRNSKDEPRWPLSCLGACLGRDAQHPAGLDQVGVLDRRRVGLDDLGVLGAVAVELLGDLPQGVALLDRVHLGLGPGLLHLQPAGVDLRHAYGVADRERDFLGFLLAQGLARDLHLVALYVDVEVSSIEAVALDLLLEILGSCRLGLAAQELRARFFDEVEQAHIVPLCSGARPVTGPFAQPRLYLAAQLVPRGRQGAYAAAAWP